jgi:SOS-response transcriptional repressor LexA
VRVGNTFGNGDIVAVSIKGSSLVFRRCIRHMDLVILMREQREQLLAEYYSVDDVKVFGKAIRVISSLE